MVVRERDCALATVKPDLTQESSSSSKEASGNSPVGCRRVEEREDEMRLSGALRCYLYMMGYIGNSSVGRFCYLAEVVWK
jgi:hypothetical protein